MSEIEDHEKEYLIRLEREERYKKEFLRTIQELIDERDAQNKLESQQQSLVSISSESQGKSRKELFEEYEKKFLNELAVRSKERAKMRKKADEIVTKRLSESQPQTIILEKSDLKS